MAVDDDAGVAPQSSDERGRAFYETIAAATEPRAPEEPAVLHGFSFAGNAREYFGVWIINTLLTIVTLGLYAPWAKVRRNRYFYANTMVMGHSFDYHATGGQLLKGWLLVAAYVITDNLISDGYPIASLVALSVVLAILPWLVERALRFKARITSYRNLRLHFKGRLGSAYWSVLVGGILAFFSLGLLAPIFSRIYYRYLFDGLSYGGRRFETRGRLGALYKSIWLPALLMIFAVLPALVLAAIVFNKESYFTPETDGIWYREWLRMLFHVVFSYIAVIPFLLGYYLMLIVYRTGVRNTMLSAATFDGKHRLVSDVPRMKYVWVLMSNTVATIASLGMLRPWSAIRERRFVLAHTAIWIVGDFEELHAELESAGSAFGSEFMDSDGFDLGF